MTKLMTDPVLEMGLWVLCEVNIKCSELNPSISKDVWIIVILLVLCYEDFFKKLNIQIHFERNAPDDLRILMSFQTVH